MSNPVRIALYGGTFDPIHQGHLHVIEQLFSLNLADEVVLVPAGDPWLRSQAPSASEQDRLAMVQLAVKDLPEKIQSHVQVSDVEVKREGPSYTIDTVKEFMAQQVNAKWLLILGSDAYDSIGKWHHSEELRDLIEVLVIARAGKGLEIDALPVSASDLRAQIHAGAQEIKYLPESVWAYIKERNLYASK